VTTFSSSLAKVSRRDSLGSLLTSAERLGRYLGPVFAALAVVLLAGVVQAQTVNDLGLEDVVSNSGCMVMLDGDNLKIVPGGGAWSVTFIVNEVSGVGDYKVGLRWVHDMPDGSERNWKLENSTMPEPPLASGTFHDGIGPGGWTVEGLDFEVLAASVSSPGGGDVIRLVVSGTGGNALRLVAVAFQNLGGGGGGGTPGVVEFIPGSGTYGPGQYVMMKSQGSSGVDGITIRYTTDGTEPSPTNGADAANTGSIQLFVTTTIKAYAYRDGFPPSATTTGEFVINEGQVSTPIFTPPGGPQTAAIVVEISTTTAGATIHYTVDGSTPTTSSPVYSSAIPVSSDTTIKALAVKSGMENSAVGSAQYTFGNGGGPPAPEGSSGLAMSPGVGKHVYGSATLQEWSLFELGDGGHVGEMRPAAGVAFSGAALLGLNVRSCGKHTIHFQIQGFALRKSAQHPYPLEWSAGQWNYVFDVGRNGYIEVSVVGASGAAPPQITPAMVSAAAGYSDLMTWGSDEQKAVALEFMGRLASAMVERTAINWMPLISRCAGDHIDGCQCSECAAGGGSTFQAGEPPPNATGEGLTGKLSYLREFYGAAPTLSHRDHVITFNCSTWMHGYTMPNAIYSVNLVPSGSSATEAALRGIIALVRQVLKIGLRVVAVFAVVRVLRQW
jgi:hypothetical protein